MLSEYIKANEGKFPVSQETLIQEGFLRKKQLQDEIEYEYNLNKSEDWIYMHLFDHFKIRYGTKFEDIVRIDDKLYDKTSNLQIYLVECPPKRFISNNYNESLSLTLYERMLEVRQQPSSSLKTEKTVPVSPAIVSAARAQVGKTKVYDPSYVRLDYPDGDVPIERGVCTDVVVRALRDALHMDLQMLVHEDMKAAFSKYPKIWGLKRPDPNIDHRRVPNLQRYFQRKGYSIAVSRKKEDYVPGDIVTCTVPPNRPHIMIVSDRKTREGIPLVIHNIGNGTKEENRLFEFPLTGHYRITTEGSNNRIEHDQ